VEDETIFEYGMKGVATGKLLTNDTDVDHGADIDVSKITFSGNQSK